MKVRSDPGVVAGAVSAVARQRHQRAPVPAVGLDCAPDDLDRAVSRVVVHDDDVHGPDLLDFVLQRLETANGQLWSPIVEDDNENFHATSIIGHEWTFYNDAASAPEFDLLADS